MNTEQVRDFENHKLSMSVSGKNAIEGEKVREVFLSILNRHVSIERLGIYYNRRKDSYSIDVNLWQISCVFKYETKDQDQYSMIYEQLLKCVKLLNEDDCRTIYENMLSCYADYHSKK